MDELTIITNHTPRAVVEAWELTPRERADFDYLDRPAIEAGRGSASFIRYRGETYDLGEFSTTRGLPEFSPLTRWDGYISDSFFSGIVVKYADDCESVVVGRFYA